jgi:hypothetical protein
LFGCVDARYKKNNHRANIFSHTVAKRFPFFPNGFSSVRDAVVLHAIGSYHDPITCQGTAETDCQMVRYWPSWALNMAKRHFRFSKRLPGHLRRRYFACGWILLLSDHMQSIDQNDPVSGDVLAILCAPSCAWGSAQNDQTLFCIFRTASRPFALPILCMWSDAIMIRLYAKYQRNNQSSGDILAISFGMQNSIFLTTNSKKHLK